MAGWLRLAIFEVRMDWYARNENKKVHSESALSSTWLVKKTTSLAIMI